MKLGILEQGSAVRPSLLGAVSGGSAGAGTSRTISVTPPAGTTMIVALIATFGATGMQTPTWAGTAMSVGRAYSYTSNGSGDAGNGIFYKTGIVAGVAQDFVLTSSDSWSNSLVRIFCLGGAYTVGAGDQSLSTGSAASVTNDITIANDYAFVLAVLNQMADNNTPGAMNLSDGSMTSDAETSFTKLGYATSYHPTPAAGAQAYTWTESNANWIGSNGNGHRMLAQALDVYG